MTEPKKPSWFRRHKILTGVGAVIALAVIASAAGSGGSDSEGDGAPASETIDTPTVASEPTSTAPTADGAPAEPTEEPTKAPAAEYAGKMDGDKLASGGQVQLSGWTTTTTALKRVSSPFGGKQLCSMVTLVNRDDEAQDYTALSWKLQSPAGVIEDVSFVGDKHLSSGSLAPAGMLKGVQVCFEDSADKGQFVLSWQPDIFSSEDRGVWLNRL